jgi:hypothetical protein
MALLLVFAVLGPRGGVKADQERHGYSGTGDYEWELRGDTNAGKEIWIWERGKKENATKLCDTQGWCCLKMHLSPDDSLLIVEDGGASLGVSLRLFRQTSGRHYHEIQERDINQAAERAALKGGGLPSQEGLDHRYVECLGWSSDSKAILIRLTGNGSSTRPRFNVSWLGVYDIKTGRFDSDLRQFNGKIVLPTPRERE